MSSWFAGRGISIGVQGGVADAVACIDGLPAASATLRLLRVIPLLPGCYKLAPTAPPTHCRANPAELDCLVRCCDQECGHATGDDASPLATTGMMMPTRRGGIGQGKPERPSISVVCAPI